ncbi:hypothetical protein K474DRAFT_1773141 [Panus rudis PR-1116 ss-1]|nr:hypothetical protein K474DRAFT_1773141 [Panus rudis PR-1116 ss-1]
MLCWLELIHAGHLHRDIGIHSVFRWKNHRQCSPFSSRAHIKSLVTKFSRDAKTTPLHRYEFKSASPPASAAGNKADDGYPAGADPQLDGQEASCNDADHTFWETQLSAVCDDMDLTSLVKSAKRLDEYLAGFGLSKQWKACVVATNHLPEHLTISSHRGTVLLIMGTPRFMSTHLREAIYEEEEQDYLQSPVDDLESFVWCTLWATAYNDLCIQSEDVRVVKEVNKWRISLAGKLAARNALLLKIREVDEEYSIFARAMCLLVVAWIPKIFRLRNRYEQLFNPAQTKIAVFHIVAWEGVLDFVALLKEHEEKLKYL